MRKCIICNDHNYSEIYKGILECSSCGYIFADSHLSDQELENLYDKNYFFGEEYHDYLSDAKVLEKNFKLRLKTLLRFIKPPGSLKLLEIGCAYGFFLNLAKDLFAVALGIDISRDGIKHASNNLRVNAIHGDFLKYDFRKQQFDVVCVWDAIEHLRDPHLYLEKISKHAAKNSILAITTGDIKSVNARFRKKNWRLLHPPTHLHYFSKETITRLLNKYDYDVVYNKHCGFYRGVENIAYILLVLRSNNKKLFELLKRWGLLNWNIYLNVYDIMYVIAKKR